MGFVVSLGLWSMVLIGLSVLVCVAAVMADKAASKCLRVAGAWKAVMEYFWYRKAFGTWLANHKDAK